MQLPNAEIKEDLEQLKQWQNGQAESEAAGKVIEFGAPQRCTRGGALCGYSVMLLSVLNKSIIISMLVCQHVRCLVAFLIKEGPSKGIHKKCYESRYFVLTRAQLVVS